MKWPFRIVVGLLIVALVALVVMAIIPRPLEVDAATATRGPLDQVIADEGKTRIRERYTVSAPVSGTLARIELHEGDPVEPGTVLARMLPLPAPLLDPRAREVAERRFSSTQDAYRQAQATAERERAASQLADTERARTERLVRSGALGQADLDRVNAEARVHSSELESSEFAEKVAAHAIDEARAALETFSGKPGQTKPLELTSPVHGRVLHVMQKSEGVENAGTALLEVGDPHAIEIVVDVLSQDAVSVRPGMSARVVHWGEPEPIRARVRLVEPAAFTKTSALGVDEQRVNVLLDFEDPPARWEPLGDGFGVEVEITVWSNPEVLSVPTSALFRKGDGFAAFVLTGGKAKVRSVKTGHRGSQNTEILDGLSPGEQVIVHPGASIHEGVSVRAR